MGRIGYFVPEFPSQTHAFFWREITELRALGEQVELISTRRPPRSACPHQFAGAAVAQTHYVYPPRCIVAARLLVGRLSRTLAAARYLMGLKQTPIVRRFAYFGLLLCAADLAEYTESRNIKIIHTQSCANSSHIVAMCRILGGPPYSLTLHGDLPVYGTDHVNKMAGAMFVATAGSHLKDQIVQQAGFPAERVLPTWMGLDTDMFSEAGRRLYEPNRLHIVTVARLHRAKGHKYALAAMKTARECGVEIQYTIAGEGPHRIEIEAEIRRLGLMDHVRLVGPLSEEDVLDLLQRADVFVLPSVGLGEAGPISLMEAMSCSLPVVCSIIGATPEMVTNGVEGLLVAQGDEAGLADAFIRLAADPSERRRMGEAARRRAVASFDYRRTARRLLDAIKGRLHSGSPLGCA